MFSQVFSPLIIQKFFQNFIFALVLSVLLCYQPYSNAKAIDLLDAGQLAEHTPNYCNNSETIANAGLIKSTLGQFLGFECSAEFFHCRWQSDGYRTYKKLCRPGLVYDTLGTQNCNYDYNVKGCAMRSFSEDSCLSEQFLCPLSEMCVNMSQRCDGKYDCVLEEDEQNCPMCEPSYFPCVASEQCISMKRRCDGFRDCSDGTDETNCEECPAGGFYCQKSRQCIDASQRCDGVPQCLTGDDEALCKVPKEQEFICEDRNHKIPLIQLCDGIEQCPDKSDEAYCYKNIDYPLTFSQRTNTNPSVPQLGYKEPTEEKEVTPNLQELKTEVTEESSEYETVPTMPTTTTPKLVSTARDIFKSFVTKSSLKPLLPSRIIVGETRRPYTFRTTTTTTEVPTTHSEEIVTEERTSASIDENYEDEVIPTTNSNYIQQFEGTQSDETASVVMFPQVSIKNPKKLVTAPSTKTSFMKTKPLQYVTARAKVTPKTEVAQSADHFPFLQKPVFQKTTASSGSTQIIDLTSNHPDEDTYSTKRITTPRKQTKLPVEEITVPFRERTQTITAEETMSPFQTKPKTTKAAGLTLTSRRSPAVSRSSFQARLSTTKRPKSVVPVKKTDASEAEAILERINAHFSSEKGGRTLSSKDLLEKLEYLLNKESSTSFNKYDREMIKDRGDDSSVEISYPTTPKKPNHRTVISGVTRQPTLKWRPSLSSSPVRMFTSRIVRPTTRIPMMTYEDVQMRHSDAPDEDVQYEKENQSFPQNAYSRTERVSTKLYPSTIVRVSRSTTGISATNDTKKPKTEVLPMTKQAKVHDVSTFLIEALRASTILTTPTPQNSTQVVTMVQKNFGMTQKSQKTTMHVANSSKTTAVVLLSNVLGGDDQYSSYDRL